MHGNVSEWTLDWSVLDYTVYTTNPVGPLTGSNRVRRGGSWFHNVQFCRSASRRNSSPSGRIHIGFRLALPAGQ